MAGTRWLHVLRYFCADAWDEFRHSRGVNLLALGTLASTLFLASLAVLGISNVQRHVQQLRNDMRVHVYLVDAVTAEERAALASALASVGGVARVDHVDRDEALRRYRAWAPELTELAKEMDDNPLPASFEVQLAPGPGAAGAAEAVAALAGSRSAVEGVNWDRSWIQRLESLLRVARVGGLVLALFVFAAVAFIIASVLRLAVHARRDEIEIMQLVGATPSFIRGPFLVAGLAQGLIAALAAIVAVEVLRRLALVRAGGTAGLAELTLATPLPVPRALMLVALGISVGLAGSFLAVRLRD